MKQEALRQRSIKEIKSEFSSYLSKKGLSKNTIQARVSMAFYLYRYNPSLEFLKLLSAPDFETQARKCLYAMLTERKQNNSDRNVNGYLSHLRQLRLFLYPDHPKSTAAPMQKRVSKQSGLPRPCCSEVEKYLCLWKNLDNYRLQEDALDKLFLKLVPKNADITDILLKTAALNDFYSTSIFSVYTVAMHILSLHIDDRLIAGDLSLVEEIQRVDIQGKLRRFYSFATKYCSHHQPEIYPIYDSYVDRVLCHFRDTERFAVFTKADLKVYQRFVDVLNSFQQYYGLGGYSIKELDRYLWQVGKEYFPKSIKKGR